MYRSNVIGNYYSQAMNTPLWNMKLLNEKNVYEPSEDSFLLLDALEKDIENLLSFKPRIILEVGSGSGVVISAIASIMKKQSHYIAVDINPNACLVTKNTAEMNGVAVDVINADLLNVFFLRAAIDMIIFNPPYVETEDDETLNTGISQSWAGGKRGRKILDELLPCLNKALSLNGMFYLVAISYNDIEELKKCMKTFGFDGSILMRRQILGELLFILKFTKIADVFGSVNKPEE